VDHGVMWIMGRVEGWLCQLSTLPISPLYPAYMWQINDHRQAINRKKRLPPQIRKMLV